MASRGILRGLCRFVCLCFSTTITIHLFPKIPGRRVFVNARQLQEDERLRDVLLELWNGGKNNAS